MSNKPTHSLYSVEDYVNAEGESKARWNHLGSAFSHKDGKGFDLIVRQLPLEFFATGRLVIREARREDKGDKTQG